MYGQCSEIHRDGSHYHPLGDTLAFVGAVWSKKKPQSANIKHPFQIILAISPVCAFFPRTNQLGFTIVYICF